MVARTRILNGLFLMALPVGLAACSSDFGPFPMPTGYTYHHDTYKAPPGPEAVDRRSNYNRRDEAHRLTGPDTQPARPAVAMTAPNQESMPDSPTDDMTSAAVERGEDIAGGIPRARAPLATTTTVPYAPVPASAVSGGSWDVAATDLIAQLSRNFGKPSDGVALQAGSGLSPADAQAFEAALTQAAMAQTIKIAALGSAPYTLRYSASPAIGGGTDSSNLKITLLSGSKVVTEQSGVYELSTQGGAARGEDTPASSYTPPAAPPAMAPARDVATPAAIPPSMPRLASPVPAPSTDAPTRPYSVMPADTISLPDEPNSGPVTLYDLESSTSRTAPITNDINPPVPAATEPVETTGFTAAPSEGTVSVETYDLDAPLPMVPNNVRQP